MTEFTVVAPDLELPPGARFTYKPKLPLEAGALYFISVNRLLTVGRYHQDLAGYDWIIQPGLIFQVNNENEVEIWGLVVPLAPIGEDFDHETQLGLLVASAFIIEMAGPTLTFLA